MLLLRPTTRPFSLTIRNWECGPTRTMPPSTRSAGTRSRGPSPALLIEACSGGTCIPQPSTSTKLDSLGDRLMYRLAYRNRSGTESLLVNHSIHVSGGKHSQVTGVRWYEIQSPNSSPTVHQQGTFSPDSTSRWMGSIAMDKAGNIALGYSTSSGSVFPAIRFTGRVPIDPLGTMEGENSIQPGAGSQVVGLSRWGDYSSMSMDPVDDCTFWYTNEYLMYSGTYTWSAKALTVPFAPLRTYRKRPSLLKAMSDGFKVLPSGARMEAAAD